MGKLPSQKYKFGKIMNSNFKFGVSKEFPLQTPYTEFNTLTKQIFENNQPEYIQRVKKVEIKILFIEYF